MDGEWMSGFTKSLCIKKNNMNILEWAQMAGSGPKSKYDSIYWESL